MKDEEVYKYTDQNIGYEKPKEHIEIDKNKWTEGYKQWAKDMKTYYETVGLPGVPDLVDQCKTKEEPKCDCGIWKTYGKKVSLKMHSNWCKLLGSKK